MDYMIQPGATLSGGFADAALPAVTGKRKAISYFFRQFGTVVDTAHRTYTLTERWFGIFRFATTRPLPKIDYVLVFRTLFAKCEACSFDDSDENPNAYFQVSLVHHSNRRIVVHESRSRDEAFEIARKLVAGLGSRLRDSTRPRR